MDFLVFTKDYGILTKSINIEDEEIKKDASQCRMCRGVCETRRVGSLADFRTALTGLQPNQAISLGVCEVAKNSSVRVVTKAETENNPGCISRTKEFIKWGGGVCLVLLDYDPPKGESGLSLREIDKRLLDILPEIEGCGRLLLPSTSAGVYKTGEEPIEHHGGVHIYVAVQDGNDIERFAECLKVRDWLGGYGRIESSKAGSMLVRSTFDFSVFDPSRLIFEARPVLGPGLSISRPDPILIDGDVFDTSAITVSDDQIAEFNLLVERAKLAAKPEADKIKSNYRQKKISTLSKKQTVTAAKKTVDRALEKSELSGEWPLEFAEHGTVSVVDVLRDPGRFDGCELVDPLESGEPGARVRAKLYFNDDNVVVNSFAHGGGIYKLVRQEVQIKMQEMFRSVAEIEGVLASGHYANILDRGGELVKVHNDGTVVPLTLTTLELELTKLAKPVRWNDKKKELEPSAMPDKIVKALLEKGNWCIPKLTMTTAAPFIYGGNVVRDVGLHKPTGAFNACNDRLRVQNTRAAAEKAIANIRATLNGFPFANAASENVAIAELLTLIQLPVIDTMPAFGHTAPTPGTGKTKLAEGLGYIATGTVPAPLTFKKDEAEISKTLLSALRGSSPILLFDNVRFDFGGDAMCAMVGSGRFSDRVLGSSRVLSLPAKTVVVATGNNLVLRNDMTRRTLLCTMDARMERPEERRFDRDFLTICRERRTDLLTDALTILAAYAKSGAEVELPPYGSFETWSQEIRAPLVWLGVADPLLAKPMATADDAVGDLEQLLEVWREVLGHAPLTIKDALTYLAFENFAVEIWPGRNGGVDVRRMGWFFRQNAGRIVDGCRLIQCGTRHKVALWKLEETGSVGVLKIKPPPRADSLESTADAA